MLDRRKERASTARRRWLCAAALAAGLLAPRAHAQDLGVDDAAPLVEERLMEPLADGGQLDAPLAMLVEQDGEYVAGSGALSKDGVIAGDYGATYAAGPSLTQPANWISGPYLRAGVAIVLGENLLENQDAGYTITGGFRQPWGPAFDERLFWDFGGSYLSAFGPTTRNTSGLQITRISGVIINTTIVPNAFSSTLDEIRRGSVHAAFGWYWGDTIDNRSADPQLRIATRFGGRAGHMHGEFDDTRVITPPANATLEVIYDKTDTFGGLFLGTEAILLRRDTPWGSCQWTLDGEFANDWIDFSGFDTGSLGTASLTLGFMLSR